MAWSTPTSRSTGYVVPDTEWNQNTVDNPVALRGGALALAGQTAGDVITASSATQLTRIPPGAIGNVLKSDGSAWVAGSSPGAMSLITTSAGSGTATGSSSTVVATASISGLSAMDGLVVMVTGSPVSGTPSLVEIYNSTDSLSIQGVSTLPATINEVLQDVFWVTNGNVATKVISRQGSNTAAKVTFVTNWTSTWTLGLRINAAGGSFHWRWVVMKLAGA